jgi:hypothetical protein
MTRSRTTCRRPTAVLSLVAALWLAGGPVAAQEEARLRPQDFLVLQGAGCAVRYTPGGLDRAHHLLNRVQLLTDYFQDWSEMPTPTVVYVMNREEWVRAGLPPVYGMPLRLSRTSIAQAASGDDPTVGFWRRTLGVERLPLIPGVPLQGTMEEAAAMAIADVLLQVETMRSFVERMGLQGRQYWVGEVVSHALAQLLFVEHESRSLGERLGGPGAHDADEYRPLPLEGEGGLERWLWFQSQFFDGGQLLSRKDGMKTVKRLLKAAKESGGLLTESQLLAQQPKLAGWLETAFAEGD